MTAAKTAWVVGTTGLSKANSAALAEAGARIPMLYAAHFGFGINLLAAIARLLGVVPPPDTFDVEILEMHHRQKRDTPSSSTSCWAGRWSKDAEFVWKT